MDFCYHHLSNAFGNEFKILHRCDFGNLNQINYNYQTIEAHTALIIWIKNHAIKFGDVYKLILC